MIKDYGTNLILFTCRILRDFDRRKSEKIKGLEQLKRNEGRFPSLSEMMKRWDGTEKIVKEGCLCKASLNLEQGAYKSFYQSPTNKHNTETKEENFKTLLFPHSFRTFLFPHSLFPYSFRTLLLPHSFFPHSFRTLLFTRSKAYSP